MARVSSKFPPDHRSMSHPRLSATAWPAAMIVWGPGFAASPLRHHCVQLLMVMSGKLLIRSGPRQDWMACEAVFIRPGAMHEVDASGATMVAAFVDVASELGAELSVHIHSDLSPVSAQKVGRWRTALGESLNQAAIKTWINKHLLHKTRNPKVHPGVKRAVDYLRENIGATHDVSLDALAEIARLSRSRFMHVFTKSVGVPLRPYILWLRLQKAASEIARGATPTEAAYRAGFADAAHMARTFRRMLGNTPTQVASRREMTHALPVRSAEQLRAEQRD